MVNPGEKRFAFIPGFKFDKVFSAKADQRTVYDESVATGLISALGRDDGSMPEKESV